MSFFSKRHYHIVSVLYVLEYADILRISRGRVDVYKNPAALTKHSMSRWAASPMAITATGSTWCDTLRLVWQRWLCVQRWNVVDMTHWYDVMSSWCDPDVLAHRNHTDTLLSIAALRKVCMKTLCFMQAKLASRKTSAVYFQQMHPEQTGMLCNDSVNGHPKDPWWFHAFIIFIIFHISKSMGIITSNQQNTHSQLAFHVLSVSYWAVFPRSLFHARFHRCCSGVTSAMDGNDGTIDGDSWRKSENSQFNKWW